MKKICSKVFFIIMILFSLTLQTGCFILIGDNGEILFEFDKPDVKTCYYDENTSYNVESSLEEEVKYSTFVSGTITDAETVIETEHFIVELDEHVYVPGYLEEYLEVIYDALESVTCLSFYNEHYNPGKITIEVEQINSDTEGELGTAYAYSNGSKIHISSGSLLLGNSYALTHELSHILQYSQSTWSYSGVLVEGYAQYTSYKVVKYLEEHNPQVAVTIDSSKAHISDVYITGDLYSNTITHWIENEKETYNISANGKYSVGMRFMDYLDSVYGNHSEWIHYYEKVNPYYTNSHVNQEIDISLQLEALTSTYGKSVFIDFYDWFKENGERKYSSYIYNSDMVVDMTKLKYTYVYPFFYNRGHYTAIPRFIYNNLYVNIDEARKYLSDYKGKDVGNLTLVLLEDIAVELYDSNDNLIDSRSGT